MGVFVRVACRKFVGLMLVYVAISRPFEQVPAARMDVMVLSPNGCREKHAASRCLGSKALAMVQGGSNKYSICRAIVTPGGRLRL